jgi:hypothetical protein
MAPAGLHLLFIKANLKQQNIQHENIYFNSRFMAQLMELA